MRFFQKKKAKEEVSTTARFERALLPHLEAAYNLARWLMKNDSDAEDMVQDACLRALKAFDAFRGDNFRAWLLRIVRNACYSQLKSRASTGREIEFDEEIHDFFDDSLDPATVLLGRCDAARLAKAIAALPAEFREVLILREIEEMSYQEIAVIAAIPLGTVMSRLARARRHLRSLLLAGEEKCP